MGEVVSGHPLGSARVTVPGGLLPELERGFAELTLETPPFVPAELGLSGDRRALGIMLESVEVAQAGGGGSP